MGYLPKIKNSQSGQSIIELILVIGLLAVLIPTFLTGTVASLEGKPQEKNRLKALEYAKNQLEKFKSYKSDNWNSIETGEFYLQGSGGVYTLVSGQESIDGNFSGSLLIEQVLRNSEGSVASEGTVDPSTFKVTSTVEWTSPIPSSVELETLISRIDNNYSFGETSESDFTNGNLTDSVITNISGGEVELEESGPSGPGDWSTPQILDTHDDTGGANALAAEISGNYLYIGSTSLGSDEDLYVFDISDPDNLSLVWSADLGGTPSNLAISGNYMYVAQGKNFEELEIFDISNPASVTQTAALSVGDRRDAYAVAVSGDYAYVGKETGPGANRELYVVNVTNKSAPSTVRGIEISHPVKDLLVVGSVLYLATNNDSAEVQAYSISNPSSPSLLSTLDLPSGSNGDRLYSANGRLYVTTENNSTGNEFYIVNVNNPSSMSVVGGYDVGSSAYSVAVLNDQAFVANATTGKELLILDIATESSPSEYGYLDLGDAARDVQLANGYAYIATNNDSQEVIIAAPGSSGGGGGYLLSGSYESQAKDFGQIVGLNYLDFDVTTPENTSLTFQVAVNNDNSTWNYAGPDGTSGTYFESAASFPLIYAEGRYLKVKAYLSGDGTATPVLSSFTVNYSE